MNMYLHELKSLRKSTLIWTLVLIAVAAMYLSLYPAIMKDAEGFKKLLGNYSPYMLKTLGVVLDSVTTLLGFYTMVMAFVSLLGAIQAMNMGVSIVSKEVRERTADFLLVKPVSRASILTAKLLAALTALLFTNIIYFAAASILASIVKQSDYSSKLFFMINLTLLFVQLIFFAIGIFVSVVVPKIKSVLPLSLGTVFGFYFIGAILVTNDNDIVRYFTPFKYFNISYIINHAVYEASFTITGAVIVIAAMIASYIIYIKKDIHAVS